ncbi:MAG: DsbA family protein [Chloroflexi bacterium]|nr:DsbA family protein [Chloroflexota bacterium]
MSKQRRNRRAPSQPSSEPAIERSATKPRRRDRSANRPGALRRLAFPAIFLVAGLAGIAIVALSLNSPADAGDAYASRPVLGETSAPVVIHEYGDFQCPSCGAFARSIEPQIRATYIDTGRVKLVWHDFAWIGPESRDAANAARCAGDQDKFWEFHDVLYGNQAGENAGAFAKDRLKAFGASIGLEPATFDACVDANRYAGAVSADFADVRDKGFNGTPTFLIGDQRIVGAQPFETFAAAIEAALATQ